MEEEKKERPKRAIRVAAVAVDNPELDKVRKKKARIAELAANDEYLKERELEFVRDIQKKHEEEFDKSTLKVA